MRAGRCLRLERSDGGRDRSCVRRARDGRGARARAPARTPGGSGASRDPSARAANGRPAISPAAHRGDAPDGGAFRRRPALRARGRVLSDGRRRRRGGRLRHASGGRLPHADRDAPAARRGRRRRGRALDQPRDSPRRRVGAPAHRTLAQPSARSALRAGVDARRESRAGPSGARHHRARAARRRPNGGSDRAAGRSAARRP